MYRTICRTCCRLLGRLISPLIGLVVIYPIRIAWAWAGYDAATRIARDMYPSLEATVRAIDSRRVLLVRQDERFGRAHRPLWLRRDWLQWQFVAAAFYLFYLTVLLRAGGPWR